MVSLQRLFKNAAVKVLPHFFSVVPIPPGKSSPSRRSPHRILSNRSTEKRSRLHWFHYLDVFNIIFQLWEAMFSSTKAGVLTDREEAFNKAVRE